MVFPIRLCASQRGALVLLMTALMVGVTPMAHADAPVQRRELAAALRQLNALERLITQSAANAPVVPDERYHFDYPRLLADLARVRAGIHDYLSPSRAQPRDPAELLGDYRQPPAPATEPEGTP